MSQTASFLTDYLFPGLLIGCGCLGLGVVNHLSQGSARARSGAPDGSPGKDADASQIPAPMAASSAPAPRPPAAMIPRRAAGPRVAPLRPVARPTRHGVRFVRRRTRVSDAERERLRIFLAAARPGAGQRFKVVGHPEGRIGKRRARRRAARVVKLLRALGVAGGSILPPEVAPTDSGAGDGVTIVVGKR